MEHIPTNSAALALMSGKTLFVYDMPIIMYVEAYDSNSSICANIIELLRLEIRSTIRNDPNVYVYIRTMIKHICAINSVYFSLPSSIKCFRVMVINFSESNSALAFLNEYLQA